MRLCSCAVTLLCDYVNMQPHTCVTAKLCGAANVQLYDRTAAQLRKQAIAVLCGRTTAQLCNFAIVWLCGYLFLYLHKCATAEPHNRTTVRIQNSQWWNVTNHVSLFRVA